MRGIAQRFNRLQPDIAYRMPGDITSIMMKMPPGFRTRLTSRNAWPTSCQWCAE
jgi:hypothetical protein